MKYVECPDLFIPESIDDYKKTLFLGGGISGVGNWQAEMVRLLQDTELILINPRRTNFDVNNTKMTVEQIQWEYHHLNLSHARMFWFPPETLCPITLFELGRFSVQSNPLFVGCDPKYARSLDLEEQMKHVRRSEVMFDLEILARQIILYAKHMSSNGRYYAT
jgi:hypothetical protein